MLDIYIYCLIIILAKYPPSAGFPSPSEGVAPSAPRLGCPRWLFAAAFGGSIGVNKTKENLGRPRRPMFRVSWTPLLGGAYGAHGLKYFRRVMRIPNMCLVLKLDNEKVVSIANEQTDTQNHANIQYRIII